MFGSRDRVAGHEVNALGQMRFQRIDDGLLDRTNVCDYCTRFQGRADLLRDGGNSADRNGDDDDIGTDDAAADVIRDFVGDFQFDNFFTDFGADVCSRNRIGNTRGADSARHGGADQS